MSVTQATPRPHLPRVSWLESKTADRTIHFNQRFVYWIARWAGSLMLLSRRIDIEELDLVHGSRYVIVSNHQSAIDPFFICSQVPFATWRHFGALHYFTGNYFMNLPILRMLLPRLGCFPAKAHPVHPYGLDYAMAKLKRGDSVLIFPEGRRVKHRGEIRAHRGVEVLAREPHVMLVPARIEWRRTKWRWGFAIGIGKPIDASKMSAQRILDLVYDLPIK